MSWLRSRGSGDGSCMGQIRTCYRPGLPRQHRRYCHRVTAQRHELHHKGLSTGMKVYHGAHVAGLQIFPLIANDSYRKYYLFMLFEHVSPLERMRCDQPGIGTPKVHLPDSPDLRISTVGGLDGAFHMITRAVRRLHHPGYVIGCRLYFQCLRQPLPAICMEPEPKKEVRLGPSPWIDWRDPQGPGNPHDRGQLRHSQTRQRPRVDAASPAFSHAFYPHVEFLVELGGAVLRRPHTRCRARRKLPQCPALGPGHRVLSC